MWPCRPPNQIEPRALLVPTVGGVFLFVDQMRVGSPDSPLLPIFCILIMVCMSKNTSVVLSIY